MEEIILSEDMKDAVHRLSEYILQDSLFQEFDRCRSILVNNPEAMALLNTLADEQKCLLDISSEQELDDDDLHKMEEMEERVSSHPLIKTFFEAQKRFGELLEAVNHEISVPLEVNFADLVLQNEEESEQDHDIDETCD
ncbi:MAG: YlbF family regulator [Candidatus Atribacteria bacterium]|nr:YlbF family regulator [Candidatus Atribacteria bacterium]